MKKSFLGLRTCIYKVSDLTEAKNWYSKVFETKPYFDEPFYVGFNIGGFELGLQPDEDNPMAKRASVLTYWGVDNIEVVYQALLENGATPHEAPINVGGAIMVATVKDPWNNIVGIIYNPDFKMG